MGAGEFDQRYPIHPDVFNVYVVDHNVSALTSHVKKPGVTFVYHPGLVEDDKTESSLMSVDYLEAPLHEEQFEFIDWFKETAKDGDFVIERVLRPGGVGVMLVGSDGFRARSLRFYLNRVQEAVGECCVL
nr:methyltransferase type 11 [Tanacetum cinerariifolium]